MTQRNTTDSPTRVQALDEVRPPEEAQIQSYDLITDDGYDHVTLDDPITPDEMPDNAERASFQYSLDEYSEEHDFVVVHRRRIFDDEGTLDYNVSGTIRLLAPVFDLSVEKFWETADTFDTWQDAEAFIAEHFEQPDAPNEYILPMPADHFAMDVARVLLEDNDRAKPFFVENLPGDDAFIADAISIDQ